MSYINITWNKKEDKEEKILRRIIDALFDYITFTETAIRVKREDVIKLQTKINEYIEKYIKTPHKIHFPILQKEDDDIEWCKARIDRYIPYEIV